MTERRIDAERAEAHRAAVDRLVTAAAGLARTIAATEELANQRAQIIAGRGNQGLAGPQARRPAPIISLADAAKRTGRHQEVLRRWCTKGRIPAVRIGRTWGISEDTLVTLLEHSARSRPRLPRQRESVG